MGIPSVIPNTMNTYDAIVEMFVCDVGSLFVCDADNGLRGIVSRKDLLRASMGNANLHSLPISALMTSMPNVITIAPNATLLHASKMLTFHKIDSLPVVHAIENKDEVILKVIGRITKTTIIRAFSKLGS